MIAAGGLIACPAEGVWGLTCDPQCHAAVMRLLALKRRHWAQGLIIVAAHIRQLDCWIDRTRVPPRAWQRLRHPAVVTWVVPASGEAPWWITGRHDSLAVRISTHPVLRALCTRAGPLVSTSANTAGAPPLYTRHAVCCRFARHVDEVIAGAIGALRGPTEVRDLLSDRQLRAAVPPHII